MRPSVRFSIGVILSLFVLGSATVVLYPLWLDSHPLKTLRLYALSFQDGKIEISSVFPGSKLYCAIGPYDSFLDSRFRKHLSHIQAQHLDLEVKTLFPNALGDNRFLLVGVSDHKINFIYRSFFFDRVTLLKQLPAGEDCIGTNGLLEISRMNGGFYLGLNRGDNYDRRKSRTN